FGARLSFFFNAHNHFLQEVAKFRSARRLWARIMQERFGATNPKAQALRFHAQTGGSTLTAQPPENNIVRVAIQALSAVAGGAQSIHTNGYDEALALPSERAARIALRTQQLLAHEVGGTDTADPRGVTRAGDHWRDLERAPGRVRYVRRATGVSVNGLAEIVLIVEDVPVSARFYEDVVGLKPESEASDEWAWFWAGEEGTQQRV